MNNKKGSKLKNIGIILAIIFIFGLMIYFASLGNAGKYVDMTKVQDMVFKGEYYEYQLDENGNNVLTPVKTGRVTDIYVVGGTGYIKVTETQVAGKSFPKFADFNFTYNNTTEDLAFIQTYNDMVDYAKANPDKLTYNIDGNEYSLEGYKDFNKIKGLS